MVLGLHTGSIMHTNLMTDIRVAQETGYDAIEFYIPKLVRYLEAGYRAEQLLPELGSLRLAVINSFLHIERQDPMRSPVAPRAVRAAVPGGPDLGLPVACRSWPSMGLRVNPGPRSGPRSGDRWQSWPTSPLPLG